MGGLGDSSVLGKGELEAEEVVTLGTCVPSPVSGPSPPSPTNKVAGDPGHFRFLPSVWGCPSSVLCLGER